MWIEILQKMVVTQDVQIVVQRVRCIGVIVANLQRDAVLKLRAITSGVDRPADDAGTLQLRFQVVRVIHFQPSQVWIVFDSRVKEIHTGPHAPTGA